MKILHFDTESAWRGGQQQLLYLLEGLVSRGQHSILLTQPESPLLERTRSAGVEARPFRARGEFDVGAAWRLVRLLREEAFDLLHCHTAHAHGIALASHWLVGRKRMPKLVVSRRVAFPAAEAKSFKLTRWKYSHADRIVAVSQTVKDGLVRQGLDADRVVVVRDGIDVERIEQAPERRVGVRQALGVREGEKIVANVAHLGEEKGQRYLIAAAPTIRVAQPDVRVVLVGEGKLRGELERQARSLGLGEAVIFAGFRPPEEIPAILKAVDVFVFPSVEEGLGSALLEAMAAGVPVVATRTGGIPEIVRDGETGLLVAPRDPQALARAVLRLLDDASLAQRLADAAHRFVRAHGTRDRMVEETIRVYSELILQGQQQARPFSIV